MRRPRPWAICDRCAGRYFHDHLRWQFDWRGNAIQNLRLLVCGKCEDVPFELNRPIIIGPDPVPVMDPRPGWYAQQMGITVPLTWGPTPPPTPPVPPSGVYETDDEGDVMTTEVGDPIDIIL